MTKDTWKKKPQGPAYIVGVTNFVYRQDLPRHASRAAMYRCLLQHLRLIPDPVVWAHFIPIMRGWCTTKVPSTHLTADELKARRLEGIATSEDVLGYQEEKKRKESLSNCKDMITEIRAAVACHPHALMRLIKNAYGQQGPSRFKAFKKIEATSPIQQIPRKYESLLGAGRPPVPVPLLPLISQSSVAHQQFHPDSTGVTKGPEISQRQVRVQWLKEYESVDVPLLMPRGSGVYTGNEGKGMAESLHAFAKIGKAYREYGSVSEAPVSHFTEDEVPTDERFTAIGLPNGRELPAFERLPTSLQMLFPTKLKPTLREPPMPKPPRHETRANPKTWKHPVRLTPRLLTRSYQRIWDELSWTRPEGKDREGPWVRCGYEEVLLWEQGRWEELERTRRTSDHRLDPAVRERVMPMTPEESYWVKHGKERKATRATINRLLERRPRAQDRSLDS